MGRIEDAELDILKGLNERVEQSGKTFDAMFPHAENFNFLSEKSLRKIVNEVGCHILSQCQCTLKSIPNK